MISSDLCDAGVGPEPTIPAQPAMIITARKARMELVSFDANKIPPVQCLFWRLISDAELQPPKYAG